MEALLIGLIIGLGGSFLTALLVNSMGARLESKVQNLSHRWMQLPQRIVIYSGITLFSAAGLNYYLHQTYHKDLFHYLEDIPYLSELAKPLRWFLRQVGTEIQELCYFLPQEMPLMTTMTVLLISLILLSSFGVRGLQKWFLMSVIGFVLVFLMRDGFEQATTKEKAQAPYERERIRMDVSGGDVLAPDGGDDEGGKLRLLP